MPKKSIRSTEIIHQEINNPLRASNNQKTLKYILGSVLLLVVIGVILVAKNKSWIVAATVNGRPVYRWDLNKKLTNQYGNQVLEMMVGEMIIQNEAKKQNLTVSTDDVKNKTTEVEKSLGGTGSLDEFLKSRGLTQADFNDQIKTQILIEKMFAKDATVSATEIDEYIKTNDKTMTATDPSQRKIEAEKVLTNQKISQKFSEWFTKAKEQSKIVTYL